MFATPYRDGVRSERTGALTLRPPIPHGKIVFRGVRDGWRTGDAGVVPNREAEVAVGCAPRHLSAEGKTCKENAACALYLLRASLVGREGSPRKNYTEAV